MTDLFKEVIPSILQNKRHVITEENEREYVPFVVNKALSYHYDCVLIANEINKLPNTDKLLQYHYLINKVRGYRRKYEKWHKFETTENLEAVREYYNCSIEKAKEALTLLSDDQIIEIRKRIYKGGLNAKSRRFDRGET